MTRGQNIGRALSLLSRFVEACEMDEEFGAAMGAPMSELRPIINRGRARQMRKLRRRIKGITGLKWKIFVAEVERRTSARFVHFRTCLGYCQF